MSIWRKTGIFVLLGFAAIVFGVFTAVTGCASTGGVKGQLVYREDFERNSGGWQPRGSASIKLVSDKAHSGTGSLYVSNRSKTWHGAMHTLTSLKSGQTYHISVWVMFDDDSAPSQGINISIQQDIDGQGETYFTIGAERVPRGEWTYIEGEYTVPRSRYEMPVSLYFEGTYKSDENTEAGDLFSFYIDDVEIATLPAADAPEPEKDIPALSEIFGGSFPLGAAISSSYLDGSNIHNSMLRHFKVLVLADEMKQDAIEPTEGRFVWSRADALVEYAERNDKLLRGHTLVWHQQVPSWLFQGGSSGALASKDQLYERMERHIKEVVGRYKGRINTWDVVNEPIEENGELRDTRYLQIAGSSEYIANAFRWAHEADPDALLCINDFGIESSGPKQDGFFNLVEDLLDQGVPVHVVGIQAHINISWPTVSEFRNAIRRFASLGVKVQITEFDMSIYTGTGEVKKRADREMLMEQAIKYRSFFEMFREEALEGNLDMVVVWGIADDDTWLNNHPVPGRTDYPLFFGKDLKAKPAYWALVDPDKMPIQIKKIDSTRADKPLSGIHDSAWDLVSPRDITDKQGNRHGWFKTMWDNNGLYSLVHVPGDYPQAKLQFFIEPRNQKLELRSEAAFTKEFWFVDGETDDSGISLLAVIPFEGKQDLRVGFDLRLDNGMEVYSWNDYDNMQETSSINYGTLNLRLLPPVTYAKRGSIDLGTRAARVIDPEWEKALPVPMTVKTMGYTEEGSQFRLLWDDDYLYVLTEVIDPALDDSSSVVHEQDTVEVFLDQNNGKTSIYEGDDGQYRVSFRNAVSVNGGDSSRFKSRTLVIPGGYRVEMAVPLYAAIPAPGVLFGFDVQINDAASGSRTGIRNWANDTNLGYLDTSGFGLLMLTE